MNHYIENLLILRYLIDRANLLRKLMGRKWPAFSRYLLEIVFRLDDPDAVIDLQRAVDNILDMALKSPARTFALEAMNQGARLKENNYPTRSTNIDEPSKSMGGSISSSTEVSVEDLIKDITAGISRITGSVTRDGSTRDSRTISEDVPAPQSEPPQTEKHISAWIKDHAGSLRKGETYILSFKVGDPVEQNLFTGPDTSVPSSDIPDGGLETEWLVISSSVSFHSLPEDVFDRFTLLKGSPLWSAKFSLHIPKEGESRVIDFSITPRSYERAELDVIIYVRKEVYRQFKIKLNVVRSRKDMLASEAVSIEDDLVHVRAAHLNLNTTHEWTTPPGELLVTVFGASAHIKGDAGSESVDMITQWSAVEAMVAGPILNVRAAAEKFRQVWEKYLNLIDPADLQARLDNFSPQYYWGQLNYNCDSAHEQMWSQVSSSLELWELAAEGYNLYNSFFPEGTDLRTWLDKLTPGEKLSITWLPTSGSGWVSHVPWGFMYLSSVAPGTEIDPLLFLGLRNRISYTAYQVQGASKALGSLNQIGGANFLYWGDGAGDATGAEARWQQQQLSAWANQMFVPSAAGNDRKTNLLKMLSAPPAPGAGVVYFFCQCSVGEGQSPVLRFGNTIQRPDVIRNTELGGGALATRPLVFANACTTLSADPYFANELEKTFFARGCRAYIGTESKVPIQLASRFAYTFFSFFYRKVDPEPMAAGEGLSQTRLFLWTQYKNIGGLFYSYVNQYEVFMAEEAEVLALRR